MVPVARRNLFQDRVRLLVSVGGVAFALLLMLALDGVVAGALARITAYIDNTGAQVYIAQPGVSSMHMAASALPLAKADEVRRVEGVARVAPILYAASPLTVADKRELAYVYGFEPATGRGGPWQMESGSADLGRGEAVLDAQAAGKLGVDLGDEVLVLGRPFRVRGLSAGTSNFINSLAFVRFDDFTDLRGQPGTASYLLAYLKEGVSPPEGVRRIREAVPDIEVLTSAEFAGEEARLVRDMSAEIMVIMNTIGFVIGLAAAGLTVYTATLAKVPECGVLKALGASNRWLYKLVIKQTIWSVGLGAGVAIVLVFGLSALFALVVPGVPLLVERESVGRAVASGAMISLIASILPVRQIAGLDPAAVFRH